MSVLADVRLFRVHRAVARLLAFAALVSLAPGLPAALCADDGDPDPGFGAAGLAVPGDGWATAVRVRADGSLRVGVQVANDIGVLALAADGSIDTTFGDDGWRVVTPYPGGGNADQLAALLVRPTGELLLVVQAENGDDSWPLLVQLTAAGALDATFGTGGIRTLSGSTDTRVRDAALQSDGKVVLVGACDGCEVSNQNDSFVARFLTDGAVDPEFGDGGWKIFNADEVDHASSSASTVILDTAERIVVGGQADFLGDARGWVGRLQTDGDLDPTFSSNGVQTLLEVPGQKVTALAVEPEKKTIFVATTAASVAYPGPGYSTALARLTEGGAIDSGWSFDGYYPLDFEEGTTISQILVQSNGRIAVTGAMNANGSQWSGFFLARFLSTGLLDPSFDGNGLKRIEFDLETDGHDISSAAALSGGRIVAVGAAALGFGYQVALVRTQSTLVFEDGFERGSTTAWLGN